MITGEEHPSTLQERMSAVIVACMTNGMGRYSGEEVTASVREGQNRLGEFIHLQKWDIKNGMTHHMGWIPRFKEATARCFVPAEITYPQNLTRGSCSGCPRKDNHYDA